MTACSTNTCGVGGWGGPLPGDPDNNSILSATPAFGGIDVSWSYPSVNPFAVAHTLLFKATSNNFNTALQIAVVSGNQYYDKTENNQLIQYFYWIKIVSVNGTVGELIGPASATAKPKIDSMMDLLTGKINSGLLAQSLRTEIDRIQLVSDDLQEEIENRDLANVATNQLLVQLQAEINDSLGIISDEITGRQEGESALLAQVNAASAAIASESVTRAAAIQNEAGIRATALLNETAARASGLSALQTQINTLQAASSGDFSNLLSVLQTEQTARIAGDAAEATSRETLAVQLRGNYLGTNSAELVTGLMYTERQARISAEDVIVASVSALSATVGTNAAALTTEATTRASADTALTNSFTTLNAQVNNASTGLPATRSALLNNYYTKATVDSAIASAVLNLVSTTGLETALGSYPTLASLSQNYYTKTATDAAISSATTTITSNFNTTLGLYVPTATLTNNYYTKTATDLAISTASTTLTSAFDVKLGLYTPTATLTNLYYTKTEADSAISAATQNLVSTTALNTALTGYSTTAVLNTNYYTKTGADAAISAAVQNLISTTALNTALSSYPTTATLTTNYYTKTAVDSAISSATQNLVSTAGLATTLASYPTTATLTNSYFTQAQTNSAISLATQNLVSNTGLSTTLGGYVTNATLTTNHYTKTQTDSAISAATLTLVSNTGLDAALGSYTTTASLQTNYYTKTQADSAISSAITTSQTTLNGNIASAQSTLQTNINTVDGKVTSIGARYTAVVSVNGLVGGFGVYNNGTVIQAGFDVNEFWVGSSQANKRKPFIISDGVTYIDDAAISKLTFTKLRDEAGTVMIENGKIKANYLQVNEILGGSFTGYNWPASGNGFYLGPSGLLLGNYNQGGSYTQITNTGDIYTRNFDIASGVMTAKSFSTVGGRFSVSSDGSVIADRVSIRRRDAAASGTGYLGAVLSTVYSTTTGGDYPVTTNTYNQDTAHNFWLDTGIDDSNFGNFSINQYYGALLKVDTSYVWWLGGTPSGSFFSTYINCEVRQRSSHAPVGSTGNNSVTNRIWLWVTISIRNVNTTSSIYQIRLDNFSWSLFKL